jgi:hypothetical protein
MVPRLTVLVAAAVLAMSAASGAAPRANADDSVQIYQVQAIFGRAASTKNLDLMMSLWYDYATLSVGDTVGYEGKNQIRTWFATSADAFKPGNHWVVLTASPNIRMEIRGNRTTLHFDCYYIDAATKAVKAESAVNAALARINGKWLITDAVFGPAGL